MVTVQTPLAESAPLAPIPQATEAEQNILGALLLWPDAYDRIDWLPVSMFFRSDHRAIYATIRALIEAGKPVDSLLVAQALEARGELENAGGRGYLASLAVNTLSAANIEAYARHVRDKAILRELLAHATDIQALAAEPGADPKEIAEEAEAQLFSVLTERDHSEALPFHRTLDATLIQRANPQRGLSTGYLDLDAIVKGLRPGELIVIAGRPSMGKSSLAACIAEHVAWDHSVALYSLEMSREEIGERVLSWHERDRGPDEAAGRLLNLQLYIDTPPTLTIGGLRVRLRRQKRKHGLALAVVDYLQLMTGKGETRTQEIGSISRGLKQLAREFEIPIVAVCQINRGVENRQDKRPLLSDLRESGDIEQDSDIVVMVYRDDYYNPDSPAKGTAEVIVRKHRNGRIGTARLTFLPDYARFENYAGGPIEFTPPSFTPRRYVAGVRGTVVDIKKKQMGDDS